jgi:hypothetical protein
MTKNFQPDPETLDPIGVLLETAKVNQATQDNALEIFKQNPPIKEFALLLEAVDEELEEEVKEELRKDSP